MSLIQDALKRKTEERNPLPATIPQEPAEQAQEALEPSKKSDQTIQTSGSDPTRKIQALVLSIAIVLIFLGIGVGLYFYLNKEKPTVEANSQNLPTTNDMANRPTPEAVQPDAENPALMPPAVIPDPQPVAKPSPEPVAQEWPKLSFSGSAVGGGQILAVINGRMLSAGKTINGVKVLQIGKAEVLVEFNGEKRVLNVDD